MQGSAKTLLNKRLLGVETGETGGEETGQCNKQFGARGAIEY